MSLTLILIIMTGLISYQAMENPAMRSKLLFRPVDIERGEWYRFFSSGLIHGDFMHLLFNMWALYVFGEVVEHIFINNLFGEVWGRVVYILFYFSAIAISSIPSYLRHRDNYAYSALGASGATSALAMMFIMFFPWNWFIFPPLPGILIAPLYIWYSSRMDQRGTDNIGHNAHLTGAIYGIFFMLAAIIIFNQDLLLYILAQLMSPQGPSFL